VRCRASSIQFACGWLHLTHACALNSHGWGLGEHNHWIKYTNWETDARIPLIIHAPHRPHTWGTRQPALVEHVDLYPTISELSGIPVTTAVRTGLGRSFSHLRARFCKVYSRSNVA